VDTKGFELMRNRSGGKPIVLGIVPARSGSKSIPGKNIAEVAGKPLMAYTIQAALKASCLGRLIVSTDSRAYADVARKFGAEVPFLRPARLARDDTPGIEPVLHAVQWLEEHQDYRPDYVMLLQPTSPIRTVQDIERSVQLAQRHRADSVISVTQAPHHPYWMISISSDGRSSGSMALASLPSRRQDLAPAYAENGAIFLVRRDVLLQQRTFYTDRTYTYVMPPERSLDIDSPWDLHLAELILRDRLKHGHD
jgi:CMP-N-acetylneuraminic acid synthetase